MSNLFTKLKKNIIKNISPFELALRTHANTFIETFLNPDAEYSNDSSSEESNCNSDESEESRNTFSSHSGSDADDENEVNIDINANQNLNVLVPIQQTFDEPLSNIETRIYSPVSSSNDNNIEQISPITSTNNNCDLNNLATETENNTNIFNDYLLINNLSILSHIEKYQKLSVVYDNTNNKLNFQIQIDDSYFPQLSRWYYNQNRTNTILTIDNLIDYGLQQYAYYNSTNNEKYIKKYNTLLNNAQKGLLNLKITYESDIENSLKISKIIEKISNL
jgi:hypothetical protein